MNIFRLEDEKWREKRVSQRRNAFPFLGSDTVWADIRSGGARKRTLCCHQEWTGKSRYSRNRIFFADYGLIAIIFGRAANAGPTQWRE